MRDLSTFELRHVYGAGNATCAALRAPRTPPERPTHGPRTPPERPGDEPRTPPCRPCED